MNFLVYEALFVWNRTYLYYLNNKNMVISILDGLFVFLIKTLRFLKNYTRFF